MKDHAGGDKGTAAPAAPEPAAAAALPMSPLAAGGVSAVLALQRTAGNALTARYLARDPPPGATMAPPRRPAADAAGGDRLQQVSQRLQEVEWRRFDAQSIAAIQLVVGAPQTGVQDQPTQQRFDAWCSARGLVGGLFSPPTLDALLTALTAQNRRDLALHLVVDERDMSMQGLRSVHIDASVREPEGRFDRTARTLAFPPTCFGGSWEEAARTIGAGLRRAVDAVRAEDRIISHNNGLPWRPAVRAIVFSAIGAPAAPQWSGASVQALERWQDAHGLGGRAGNMDSDTVQALLAQLVTQRRQNDALALLADAEGIGLHLDVLHAVRFDARLTAPSRLDPDRRDLTFGPQAFAIGYAALAAVVRQAITNAVRDVGLVRTALPVNQGLGWSPDGIALAQRLINAPQSRRWDGATVLALAAWQQANGVSPPTGRMQGPTVERVMRVAVAAGRQADAVRFVMVAFRIPDHGLHVEFDTAVTEADHRADRSPRRVRFGPSLFTLGWPALCNRVKDVMTRAPAYLATPAAPNSPASAPPGYVQGGAQPPAAVPGGTVVQSTSDTQGMLPGWFGETYTDTAGGPESGRRTHWIQFIAIGIQAFQDVAGTTPVAGGGWDSPGTGVVFDARGGSGITLSRRGAERWFVDNLNFTSPYYNAPSASGGGGGSGRNTQTTSAMYDRPDPDPGRMPAMFALPGAAMVREEIWFQTYLVRGMDVIARTDMTVRWDFLPPATPGGPVATPTRQNIAGGVHAVDHITGAQYTALTSVPQWAGYTWIRH